MYFGGYCRYFSNPTPSHIQTANERAVLVTASYGILLGANDREIFLSPVRNIAVARSIGFPVITNGFVVVCCEVLKEFVVAKSATLG